MEQQEHTNTIPDWRSDSEILKVEETITRLRTEHDTAQRKLRAAEDQLAAARRAHDSAEVRWITGIATAGRVKSWKAKADKFVGEISPLREAVAEAARRLVLAEPALQLVVKDAQDRVATALQGQYQEGVEALAASIQEARASQERLTRVRQSIMQQFTTPGRERGHGVNGRLNIELWLGAIFDEFRYERSPFGSRLSDWLKRARQFGYNV